MRIQAITVRADELQPGDLFSLLPIFYWESDDVLSRITRGLASMRSYTQMDLEPVGEKVYIRTHTPVPVGDEDAQVTKLEIILEEGS